MQVLALKFPDIYRYRNNCAISDTHCMTRDFLFHFYTFALSYYHHVSSLWSLCPRGKPCGSWKDGMDLSIARRLRVGRGPLELHHDIF